MNKDELLDILNTFIKDNNKSMLINGRWGCGKTYLINEFMNTNNKLFKRPRLYYLSAFGFKTIDELHTKVYSIIHPSSKFIKLSKILNCATPLLPHSNNLAKEALDRMLDTYEQDTKNTNRVFTKYKKSKRKFKILIIDDFEITKIDYDEMLGYFNQLYLYNIKIICIGNLNNLSDQVDTENVSNILKINKFKEKIFDREYRLNDSNEDTIKNFFKDIDNTIIDDDIIKIYEYNLRLVVRASKLYHDIKNYLIKKKFSSPFITNKTLAWYCSLITRVDIDDAFAKYECNKEQDDPFKELGLIDNQSIYAEKFNDLAEVNKLLRVSHYDDENHSLGSIEYEYKSECIVAISKYYFNNSFNELDTFIKNLSIKKEVSIYEKIPLLFNNKDKKILFSEIYEDLKTKSSLTRSEFNTILSCNEYMNNKNLLPEDFDEDTYILNIATIIVNNDNYEGYLINVYDASLMNNVFINKLKRKCNELLINKFFSDLKKYKITNNLKGFNDTLNSNSNFIRTGIIKEFDNELINKFEDNKWFISLNGTITLDEWRMNLSICYFCYDFKKFQSKLKNYLINIQNQNKDNEVFDRTKKLLVQYFNDNNKENNKMN